MNKENILHNVPPLRFWGKDAVGWYCLGGAVTRYLEYVGHPVPYSTIMGISGAAWRLVWDPGKWSPDNLIMAWYGHLSAEERIFKSLGYDFEYVDRDALEASNPDAKEIIFRRIRECIDNGKPAIACGIAGPEECLVAGYSENGRSLMVQSFFQNSEDGYFETGDWYEYQPSYEYEGHRFSGVLLVGEKRANGDHHGAFRDSLKWALRMATMGSACGRACGPAAYDAWANDMANDDEFPMTDTGRLEEMSMSISDNAIVILDARQAASDYLTSISREFRPESQDLLADASNLFKQESATIAAAHEIIPWGNVKGEDLKSRLERGNREKVAQVIRKCKCLYEEAFEKIRRVVEIEEGF